MKDYLSAYQTICPVEFTKKEKEKLKEHLNALEELLKTPNLAQLLAKEKDVKCKYLSQTMQLCPDLNHTLDELGINLDDEAIKWVILDYLDLIPKTRIFIESPIISENDCVSREFNLLGRKYNMICAGDLNHYSEEPDGDGYNLLKSLDKVNLLSVMENLTIPKSKSIHFITEED